MNPKRRAFLRAAFAGVGAGATVRAASQPHQHAPQPPPRPGQDRAGDSQSAAIATPDIPTLAWTRDGEVKVFHLAAEPVRTEFIPGRTVDVWGFNGHMPGPTVEITEGDRVRFVVENRLPEIFAVHWHGLEVPIDMDGVPGLVQDPIPPGERFAYEFTVHQHGTFFYHSHMAMQEMLGLIGLLVVHPRRAYEPRVDRDFGLIFQEWAILPNNTVPNTMSMEFNWLTINGKAAPATTPMLVRLGERVRIRMINMGMDHHPIHLHGNTFFTVGTEGGRIPESAWEPGNTVLLGVAQARDVEFEAKYRGDWMLHCHLPHHMMNQMVSMVGPMTHVGSGTHAGAGMPDGMGIIRRSHALAEAIGPGFGRAIGAAAERERAVTNLALGVGTSGAHAPPQPSHAHHGDPWTVPGYPQDMFMVTDDAVAKPETFGLRPTWTGGLMGMMTLVRVLDPDLFDQIQALKAEQRGREERG